MVSLKGLIYDHRLPERFYEGYISLEDGRITGEEEESHTVEGIVLPMLTDSHTHLADGFVLDTLPLDLEETVVDPKGIKHSALAISSPEDLQGSFIDGFTSLADEGVGLVCDFREGGREGVEIVRRITGKHAILLGRPTASSSVEDVLEASDGIGLSSILGMPGDEVCRIQEACRARKKLFAFHHAEAGHETVSPVIDASPDFVVHAIHSTRTDLRDISGAGIGIVVCPTMNAFYGSVPPVADMLKMDIPVALGTDNAMHMRPSMLETMTSTYMLSRLQRAPLDPVDIIDMCITGAKKVLRHEMPIVLEKGQSPSLVVFQRPKGCTVANAANVVVTRLREKDLLISIR